MIEQPSLFSASELKGCYATGKRPDCAMSQEALQAWKQRIFQYQQQVRLNQPVQQGSLFETFPTVDALADRINPFTLPQQNMEFWRWKASDEGVAAFYFVVDDELPILLYVGETVKSNMRWKGEHDCKRYVLNYTSAHRPYQLPVRVNIGFWSEAPVQTRDRQRIESALIYKWRSPFNKENWEFWGTPFTGGKG